MFKLVLEKAEEPEIKFPTAAGSSKKQESSRKTSISALLTVWITETVENSERDGNTMPPDLPWKGAPQGCILFPCLFNLYAEYIMRNAELDKVQAGIKCWEKYQ